MENNVSELCEGWDIFLNVLKCCTNLMNDCLHFVSVDVDECAVYNASCHHCINTIGSYNCSCDKGFELVNGSMCKGTIT